MSELDLRTSPTNAVPGESTGPARESAGKAGETITGAGPAPMADAGGLRAECQLKRLPWFSVLVISHRKLALVKQAVSSVLTQSYPYWDLTIVDSGDLVRDLHCLYGGRWRVQVAATHEPADLASRVLPVSWVLNEWMPRLCGPWLVWISDDDFLFPTYLEAMARAITRLPERHAFACGEVRVQSDARGNITRVKGVFQPICELGPGMMDCQVDGLQFVHDRWLWDQLAAAHQGRPWPEELSAARHADGIFMERAVALAPAVPVAGVHCMNRRTPLSAFCGAE